MMYAQLHIDQVNQDVERYLQNNASRVQYT